jgi:hypothetical protein
MWLSFSCILKFLLFPPSLHNTCSCYYLHSQIDADRNSVFWLVNLHPSSIQVERKVGCISIPSKFVQIFWFKFLVWYSRSKNLNSRNLNGDLDAKLVSCIPGLRLYILRWKIYYPIIYLKVAIYDQLQLMYVYTLMLEVTTVFIWIIRA